MQNVKGSICVVSRSVEVLKNFFFGQNQKLHKSGKTRVTPNFKIFS